MKQIIIFCAFALLLSCGSNNTGSSGSNPAPSGNAETAASSEPQNTVAAPNETPSANASAEASSSEFIITGKIANAPSQQVFLDRHFLNQNQQNIGTTVTSADGAFTLKGKIKEKGLYLIRLSNDASWLVMLESGKINFIADANNIYTQTIEGSPEAVAFSKFIVKAGESQAALNQINQQYNAARGMGQMQQMVNAQQQYQTKHQESQNYLRSTIETSQYPLIAVFAASLLSAEENAEYLEKFIAKANQQMPGSSYVSELNQKVNAATRLSLGRVAPDFKIKSPKGETIALSGARGKVVLLDFWASWCRPCRTENPNVVRMYDKYHEKGFEVFSVSLDQNMDKWVNAIKADNLKWRNHGSTLQGWQCPVAGIYEVHSIPNALLLDKNGKIIAKNLRGEELESKLRELFGV
jgi:thiol-disulfide isomerase/thioredoxin